MKIQIIKPILDIFYPLIIIVILLVFRYLSLYNVFIGYVIYCTIAYFKTKTVLIYSKTEFMNDLLKKCPTIRNPDFKAYFYLPFTFFQFIIIRYSNKKNNKQEIIYKEEKINDEGTSIIWVSYKNDKNIHSRPVLFIFPGITGKTSDFYIKNIISTGLENNFDLVIYQMRTLCEEMKMPKDNQFVNFCEEVDDCLKRVKEINNNKLYAIGYSYGANTLTKYLSSKNVETNYIEGAISISNPFDLFISQRIGEGNLYEHVMIQFEKKNYIPGAITVNKVKPNYFDINRLRTANTAKEFDGEFFVKVLGYKNGDDYYRQISSYKLVKNINVPFLIINAKDDPVCNYKGIPIDDISENKNIILILTDKGAHSCYIENESQFSLKTRQWILKPIIEFLTYLKENSLRKCNKY